MGQCGDLQVQIGETVVRYSRSLAPLVGVALRARETLERQKTPQAVAAALAAWSSLLRHQQITHCLVLHAVAWAEYGLALGYNLSVAPQPSDTDDALQALKTSLEQVSPDVQEATRGDRPRWLSAVGVMYRHQYERSGFQQKQAIALAVQYGNEALASAAPGSLYWKKACINLANALRIRFDGEGTADSLTMAAGLIEQVLAAETPGSQQWMTATASLTGILMRRYQHTGARQDLTRILAVLEHACSLAQPADHRTWGSLHQQLAAVLRIAAQEHGDTHRIEQSLDVARRGIAPLQTKTPVWWSLQFEIANSLDDRASLTGNVADLDDALARYQQLLSQTSPGSFDWLARMANYAGAMFHRYRLSGQSADLDHAIELYHKVKQSLQPETHYWLQVLNNLGVVLDLRAQRTGQIAGLTEALQHFTLALQHAKRGSAVWADLQYNQALAYSTRYDVALQSGDQPNPDDIERAIQGLDTLLQYYPHDTDTALRALLNRATAYYRRFERTMSQADRRVARQGNDQILTRLRELGLTNEHTLQVLTNRATLSMLDHQWVQAANEFLEAVGVADRLYQQQVLRHDRDVWQARAMQTYRRAAYSLAMAGRLAEAVVCLEKLRARGLAEAMAVEERDLSAARQRDPMAAQQYEQALARLRYLNNRERLQQFQAIREDGDVSPAGRDVLRKARAVAEQELVAARKRIQHLVPHQDDIGEPTFRNIAAAVAPGAPLLYLDISNVGCLAIIIHRASAQAQVTLQLVPMPALNIRDLLKLMLWRDSGGEAHGFIPAIFGGQHEGYELQDAIDQTLAAVLDALRQVIEPCTQQLRLLGARSIVLLPGFIFSLLPIHAVEYTYRNQTICLGDEFELAYAPSAITYGMAQRQSPVMSGSLVAAVNPASDPAPFTDWLAREFATLVSSATVLDAQAATRDRLLATLTASPRYLIFGCHGQFNADQPLSSSLALHQSKLTLSDVFNELRIRGTRLVMLCSCTTGMREFGLVMDEAIGFPAAMLLGGCTGGGGSALAGQRYRNSPHASGDISPHAGRGDASAGCYTGCTLASEPYKARVASPY